MYYLCIYSFNAFYVMHFELFKETEQCKEILLLLLLFENQIILPQLFEPSISFSN